MLIVVPDVLNEDEIRTVSATVKQADFSDGRATAGPRSRGVKNNLQTHGNTDPALQALILAALARNGLFNTVAAPKKIIPPRFNLYKEGMYYGDHVDNAIMQDAGAPLRVDMSFTLFISGPKDYGGGELVIKGPQGPTPFKLPAGHMIVYPTYYYHEVTPVTRGERLACVTWLQSMIRDSTKRDVLLELALASSHIEAAGNPALAQPLLHLERARKNLLRLWVDT